MTLIQSRQLFFLILLIALSGGSGARCFAQDSLSRIRKAVNKQPARNTEDEQPKSPADQPRQPEKKQVRPTSKCCDNSTVERQFEQGLNEGRLATSRLAYAPDQVCQLESVEWITGVDYYDFTGVNLQAVFTGLQFRF